MFWKPLKCFGVYLLALVWLASIEPSGAALIFSPYSGGSKEYPPSYGYRNTPSAPPPYILYKMNQSKKRSNERNKPRRSSNSQNQYPPNNILEFMRHLKKNQPNREQESFEPRKFPSSGKSTNDIRGKDNVAKGKYNSIKGKSNIAEGNQNTARGVGNVIRGVNNQVGGKVNIVDGCQNDVKGVRNVVEGGNNDVRGRSNEVEGRGNEVQGRGNIVEGRNNDIEGKNNKVEGGKNEVRGAGNIIEGKGNTVVSLADLPEDPYFDIDPFYY